MAFLHGVVAGGEAGGREGVPGSTGGEEESENGCMAFLCGVHERIEALAVKVGDVGAGVYESLHSLRVTLFGRLAQLLLRFLHLLCFLPSNPQLPLLNPSSHYFFIIIILLLIFGLCTIVSFSNFEVILLFIK